MLGVVAGTVECQSICQRNLTNRFPQGWRAALSRMTASLNPRMLDLDIPQSLGEGGHESFRTTERLRTQLPLAPRRQPLHKNQYQVPAHLIPWG